MIGDNRLVAKSYGRVFLDGLPRMLVTRQLEDLETCFVGPIEPVGIACRE